MDKLMMTPEQLAAIRARAEAVPFDGPFWASTKADGLSMDNGNILWRNEDGDVCVVAQTNNYFHPTFPLRDFLAQAKTDIPALLDHIERLQAKVDALESLNGAGNESEEANGH